jgi:hypothetical protein
VATILGDLANDIVVVGGLVPYLIVDQQAVEVPHVGTRDLDLGLALALLDEDRYREVSARLRDRGFRTGTKSEGQVTRQTWILPGSPISIDFLIPRSGTGPEPGRLQPLDGDFAAIVTPALAVAFEDFLEIVIDDLTPDDERARRSVKVCGPAAFIVMKAHAFRLRGENKDAYDLLYVLKHFGDSTTGEVADRFQSIAHLDEARAALDLLAEDLSSPQHLGPVRSAQFSLGRKDARTQADAFGFVQGLPPRCLPGRPVA